jgi:hypothetical protein
MEGSATTLDGARAASLALESAPPRVRRPGKLDPGTIARICDRIEAGAAIKHACLLEGVTAEALRLRREADPDVAFQVERARAVAVEAMREEFLTLVRTDRRSAMALLSYIERADPETYGAPKMRHEIGGVGGGPIVLSAQRAPASPEEALARIEALHTALLSAGVGTVGATIPSDPEDA